MRDKNELFCVDFKVVRLFVMKGESSVGENQICRVRVLTLSNFNFNCQKNTKFEYLAFFANSKIASQMILFILQQL